MKYFGYQLVMLAALEGVPLALELVSANVEERSDAEKAFDDRLNRFRQRIESTFNSIQNNDRNWERLLAKTILGFCPRVIAKIYDLHSETGITPLLWSGGTNLHLIKGQLHIRRLIVEECYQDRYGSNQRYRVLQG